MAVPSAASGTPLASGDAPSAKEMVPAVTGLPAEVTVAVNVTDCPTVDGFTLDVNAVVVAAIWTTWSTLPELVAKLGVPE